MTDELPITIRLALEAERKFCIETTLKVRRQQALRGPDRAVAESSWSTWERAMRPKWGHPQRILVAESAGVVLGFLAQSGVLCEMIYVKRGFRGERIGVRLWRAAGEPAALDPTPSWRLWKEYHRREEEAA